MIRSCVLASFVVLFGIVHVGCGNHSRSKAPVGSTFQISTASLPNSVVNSTYDETLAAVNGTQPLSWGVVSGSLPTGLALGPTTGRLNGVITATGNFSFRARVVDGAGQAAERDYTISVLPSNVTWGSLNLPGGVVGQAYSTDLKNSVSGGTQPYTFSVDGGALPPGLSLSTDGIITGTPTTAGSYQVTFRVVAGGGQSAATSSTTMTIS